PPDVEVTVAPLGCSFRPAFFPYTLNEVRGTIHYHQGQVELTRLTAQHGPTALGLELGRVFLKPTGGLVVNLFGVSGDPLVPDDEFVTAMPQRMRETCATLQLRDPMTLLLVHLAIDLPANPGTPPYVYWEGVFRPPNAT